MFITCFLLFSFVPQISATESGGTVRKTTKGVVLEYLKWNVTQTNEMEYIDDFCSCSIFQEEKSCEHEDSEFSDSKTFLWKGCSWDKQKKQCGSPLNELTVELTLVVRQIATARKPVTVANANSAAITTAITTSAVSTIAKPGGTGTTPTDPGSTNTAVSHPILNAIGAGVNLGSSGPRRRILRDMFGFAMSSRHLEETGAKQEDRNEDVDVQPGASCNALVIELPLLKALQTYLPERGEPQNRFSRIEVREVPRANQATAGTMVLEVVVRHAFKSPWSADLTNYIAEMVTPELLTTALREANFELVSLEKKDVKRHHERPDDPMSSPKADTLLAVYHRYEDCMAPVIRAAGDRNEEMVQIERYNEETTANHAKPRNSSYTYHSAVIRGLDNFKLCALTEDCSVRRNCYRFMCNKRQSRRLPVSCQTKFLIVQDTQCSADVDDSILRFTHEVICKDGVLYFGYSGIIIVLLVSGIATVLCVVVGQIYIRFASRQAQQYAVLEKIIFTRQQDQLQEEDPALEGLKKDMLAKRTRNERRWFYYSKHDKIIGPLREEDMRLRKTAMLFDMKKTLMRVNYSNWRVLVDFYNDPEKEAFEPWTRPMIQMEEKELMVDITDAKLEDLNPEQTEGNAENFETPPLVLNDLEAGFG